MDDERFIHLDSVMGSIPMIKRYIVLTLCFTVGGDISRSDLEVSLVRALETLKQSFPFFAGRVVYKGREEGKSGSPRVVPHRDSIELIIRDERLSDNVPSLADLANTGYPIRTLDAAWLAPPIATSWSSDGYDTIAPVFILQVTIIKGGVLLTFCGNHTQMDMTGLGGVISLFAQAARGEPFTEEQKGQGNQDRRNVMPLLGDEYQPGSEITNTIVDPSHQVEPDPSSMWAYFHFTADRLSALKIKASDQNVVPYISTDDALAALLWQRVSKVRASRLGNDAKTTFARPVSTRNFLGLKGYLGHMVDVLYEDEVDVYERPLGEIAGRLRKLLRQDEKIVHHVRALATMLDRLDDKSKIMHNARGDPNRDVVLSSYANIKCCELSFGPLLGMPDVARRPKMPPWPALCYLMPKSRDGGMALAVCLGEADMKGLREDEIFRSYADYIG